MLEHKAFAWPGWCEGSASTNTKDFGISLQAVLIRKDCPPQFLDDR